MIEKFELKPGDQPTEEQLLRISEAKKHPIVFDEECPAITSEMIDEMKKAYSKKAVENPIQCHGLLSDKA